MIVEANINEIDHLLMKFQKINMFVVVFEVDLIKNPEW
jgi:hypothetical protein